MKLHLIIIKFLYILLPLIERIDTSLNHNRDKRYLIFPRANPTRHQFIAGIGIPVDLEEESVTIGYVLKAQYFLPYNVSQLRPGVFFPSDDFGRKSRQRRSNTNHSNNYDGGDEQYVVNVEEIDRRPVANTVLCESRDVLEKRNNLRWDIYKSMEYINYGLGYHGRDCVLRLICEMAGTKIHQSSGILADVTKLILTPSITNEKLSQSADIEYRQAELNGSTGKPCNQLYLKCNLSILDMFTKLL